MNYLSIDHLIVYGSLLTTLIVGLRAGRGIKTIREYAVGNKMFGTAALVFTYMATNLAGSVMFSNGGLVFSDGIIVTCSFFGFCVAEIMIGIFVAPKATCFGDCFTMGDLIQKFYGRYAGIIAGLLGLIQATLIAGMELIAIGLVCESLLGIKAEWGIMIGGIILAIYSAHGGIKAVVATDILQFITLMAVIPIAAEVALHRVGGLQALFHQLPPEKLSIFSHEKFSYYLVCFLVWGVFPSSVIDPAIIQRMLMAKSPIKLRRQYFITALINPITHVITMLIALAGFVLYPTIEANNTIPYTLSKILPMGIKGCTAAGLIALIMSTVDSCLHVAGLTLIHDVVRPLCSKSLTSYTEKRFAQMSTMVIGVIAIAIGLHTTDIFGLFLGVLETTGPILMFPLLTGIMGLKPEKSAFYMAMCATILVWIGCKCFLPETYDYLSLLITIVTNGVTFLGTHLYIHKGFKTVKRKKELYLNECNPPGSFFQDILPKNLLIYVQKQLKVYNPPYVLAGIFCLLNLIAPHFLWDQVIKLHTKCLLVAHVVGGILAVLLMTKEKWSKTVQVNYLPILFYVTLLYCLPFVSTLMFIISRGDGNWLAHLLISLTFLLVLVDWGMVLLLTVLGMGLSLLFYPHFGAIDWEWHTTSSNLRMYQLLFALLVGLSFARRKEKKIHQLEQEKQQLCQGHALLATDYLHNLQYQALQKKYLEIQKEPLWLAKEALRSLAKKHPSDAPLAQKALEQLDAFVTYCKVSFYQTMDAMRLHIRSITLTDLLVQINKQLHDIDQAERIRIELITNQKDISCDVDKMVQLLTSQIKSLLQDANVMLTLSIQDTQLEYHLEALPGFTRKLPALGFLLTQAADVDSIQTCYQGTTLPLCLEVPKTAMELPERNQAQLIEAHYGYQASSTLRGRLYVLPIEVNKIRAVVVDQYPMSSNIPLDNPDSIALERTFLQRLLETDCLLDFTIAREAIDMIKQVHQGKLRKSGELYYTHPLMVSTIVLTMTQDPDAILAALLHDVLEDTPVHLEQLAYQYGQKVAYLVQQVTYVDPAGKKTKLTEGESHEPLAASSDKYAVMIKLADRLHNMRTLGVHQLDKQRHIAQETLDFYLPLSNGLKGSMTPGVQRVVDELKAISEVMLHK